MSLMFLVPFVASGAGGKFNAPSSATRRAEVTLNGAGIDGDLDLAGNGSFNWNGDNAGTDVDDTWWSSTSPAGTWHFRLRYSSGTNFYQATGSESLNTWYQIDTVTPHYNFYENGYGTGGGSQDGIFLADWSDDGGSTIYHTCTLTIRMVEPSI